MSLFNNNSWNNNANQNKSQQQWNNNDNTNNNNPMFTNPSNRLQGLKNYYDRSLLPTTIKQILLAPEPEPDEPFQINGKQVHQIQIIATIISINHKTTHTLFIVDDQGAKIECKLWSSDNDDIKQLEEEKLKVGNLVRIIGKVDVFKSMKSINVHNINKIKNFNVLAQHGIECIYAFEMNNILINQHIPKYNNMWDIICKKNKNEQAETQAKYNQLRNQNNSNNNRNRNNNNDENMLNDLQKKVLNYLRTAYNNSNNVNNDYLGQSIKDIGQGIGEENYAIKNALTVLYKNGLAHDMTDGNHWDATR